MRNKKEISYQPERRPVSEWRSNERRAVEVGQLGFQVFSL